MPIYDRSENLDVAQSVSPAAHTASVNGSTVRFDDYESATVVFSAGTITDGTHTPSVEISEDGGSTWSALTDADLVGSLVDITSDSVQAVGYIGHATHIRAVSTVSGTTDGGVYEACVIRGDKGSQ